MKVHLARTLGVGVALTLTACGGENPGPDYDHLAFKGQSSPPHEVIVEKDQIVMEEGLAVQATPYPVGTDGHALKGEVAHAIVVSENENVLSVLPGTGEQSVVLVASGLGTTRLLVSIQDVYVDAIPVQVIPQGSN